MSITIKTIITMEDVNDVIMKYIIEQIKGEDIDIYNVTEEQYDEIILGRYLAGVYEYDIVRDYIEYYHYDINLEMFALVKMANYIKKSCEDDRTLTYIFQEEDITAIHRLIHCYAYYHIQSIGYEAFLLELKDYVNEDDDE